MGRLRRRRHLKLVFNIKCVQWSLINTRPLLFPARQGARRPLTARKVNAGGQVISHPHQDPPCRRGYHASSRHDTSVLIYGLREGDGMKLEGRGGWRLRGVIL